MHFSEDELRQALKRKDPGEGFTQRVMARVNQTDAKNRTLPATEKGRWRLFRGWNLRPAWTFAVVAVLLLGFAWAGYEYSEYRHREDMRIAQENERQLREAEQARDQAILALRIARNKLNHVLQHAQLPADGVPSETNDKMRRQRL
jgi:hypothetical protein